MMKLVMSLCHLYSDNGFLMLPQEKVLVTFTSPSKFDVKMLQESLIIRYNSLLQCVTTNIVCRSVKDTYGS